MITECVWHVRITEWSRQQHALHGSGAAAEEPFDPDLNDDEVGDVGNVEEDEMLELEALTKGQSHVVPLVVLWHDKDAAHLWHCRLRRPTWGPRIG